MRRKIINVLDKDIKGEKLANERKNESNTNNTNNANNTINTTNTSTV
jgi:hypothetical protein